jgi:hypothetical protein
LPGEPEARPLQDVAVNVGGDAAFPLHPVDAARRDRGLGLIGPAVDIDAAPVIRVVTVWPVVDTNLAGIDMTSPINLVSRVLGDM